MNKIAILLSTLFFSLTSFAATITGVVTNVRMTNDQYVVSIHASQVNGEADNMDVVAIIDNAPEVDPDGKKLELLFRATEDQSLFGRLKISAVVEGKKIKKILSIGL